MSDCPTDREFRNSVRPTVRIPSDRPPIDPPRERRRACFSRRRAMSRATERRSNYPKMRPLRGALVGLAFVLLATLTSAMDAELVNLVNLVNRDLDVNTVVNETNWRDAITVTKLDRGILRPTFVIRSPAYASPVGAEGDAKDAPSPFQLSDEEIDATLAEKFPDVDFSDEPRTHPAHDAATLGESINGNETSALGGGYCGAPSRSCYVTHRHQCPHYRYCYYGNAPRHGAYNQCRGGWVTIWFRLPHWHFLLILYDNCKYRDAWSGYIYTCPSDGACRDCDGSWGSYDTCDAPCGRGRQKRRYTVRRWQTGYGSRGCPYGQGYLEYRSCSQQCSAPLISIGERVSHIASNNFDFLIKINHNKLCGSADCLSSTSSYRSMAKCEARINKAGASCSSYGDNLPCKRWTDFKNSISLTNGNGAMEAGDYDLTVECQVVDARGEKWSTKSSQSHSFKITTGCNSLMSRSASATEVNSEIAKYLLLTSEEFITAKCDEVNEVKESIFRSFDINPNDGVLTLDELNFAMAKQGADPYILKIWDTQNPIRLSLGQMMKIDVRPTQCSQPGGLPLTFTKAVYPSAESGFETSKTDCKRDAGAVTTEWKYGDQTRLSYGDTACVYIDGILFAEDEPKSTLPKHAKAESYQRLENSLYLLTRVVDKRPVFGGFADIQPSLVAQFTFDRAERITSERITSDSPTALGQIKRPFLRRFDGGSLTSLIRKCNDGDGAMCLDGYAGSGYLYEGEQMTGDVTFSTWMQVKRASTTAKNQLVVFEGESGIEKHTLIFGFNSATSTLSLSHETISQNGVSNTASDVFVSGLSRTTAKHNGQYSPWYLVGFRLTHAGEATVFAYPYKEPSDGKTSSKMFTRGLLPRIPKIRLFDVESDRFQFDDVRFYTGNLGRLDTFFENSNVCGRDTYCAERAQATPGSRRVLCVYMNKKQKGSSAEPFVCTGGMFYDGTAIDAAVTMDMTGVTFSFRDTSWEERGFEIERRRTGEDFVAEKFSTAVLIEADLKGCASVFNSITYIDRDASNVPNAQWLYRITSKISDEVYHTSPTFKFTTPWMTAITGRITAGMTDVPVPYVRICAEFDLLIRSESIQESFDAASRIKQETNIAQFKRVKHSSRDADIRASAYLVTDQDVDSGSSQLNKGEHLHVHLATWASVGTVRVCVAKMNQVSTSDISVYVSDADPKESGNFGIKCLKPDEDSFGAVSCADYVCKGAELTSIHGEHVIVRSDSKSINITEVEAVGNETRCKFTDTTNKDGEYELMVKDETGRIPTKAKLHIGAYREEVFPAEDELMLDSSHEKLTDARKIRVSKPSKVLLALQPVTDDTTDVPPPETPFYNITDVMLDYKDGEDDDIPRIKVEQFIANLVNLGTDTVVVITDTVWSLLDLDGDGIFNSTEWKMATQRMETKSLVLEPSVVFPTIPARRHHDFTAVMMDGPSPERSRCENMVLYRTGASAPPSSADGWRSLYANVFRAGDSDYKNMTHCRGKNESRVDPVILGDEKHSRAFMLPLVVSRRNTNAVYLDRSSTDSVTNTSSEIVFDRIMRDAVRVQLHATKQLADIAHVFDKPPTQKVASDGAESDDDLMQHVFSDQVRTKRILLDVKHKRIEEKDFTDDTTAVVTGAVLFPKSATEGSSDCGLPEAEILVIEPDKDPDVYTTDAGGWFELALPRGKTFTIRARYKTHIVCYAGATVEDAVEKIDSCEGRDDYHTISELGDGETLFFSDFTESRVDLGLFQGECDALYTGATFRITPISGCHPAATFTSEDIAGKWVRDASGDATSRVKIWPYAALNYQIEILEGSSVDGYDKYYPTLADDCETEPGSMLDFFRKRDTLNRLLRFQDEHALVEERFKYHGYICVSVTDLLPISDDTTCWDKKDVAGSLTSDHFIGKSDYPDLDVSTSRLITAKVFELHLVTNPVTREQSVQKCFAKLPNPSDKTGSTKLSFRQDVTDQAENECHHNRGGGPLCDFEVSVDKDGMLNFPRSDGTFEPDVEVTAGSPSFAAPYRRKLDFSIERFDTYFTVSKLVTRPMVTLGSKPRAGDDPRSDDVFWATVPIEGLVYTVVHDPPGGDSYAELSVGSTVGIQFDLAGTRAASADHESEDKKSLDEKTLQINPGYNLGYTAEGNMNTPIVLLTAEGSLETKSTGPKFEMTSKNQSGWSLQTTTDRAIRSSTEVALAGRAGDVILGGGIELLYKQSDVLDVEDTQNGACLVPSVTLTWLPRKPTSYLFSVASIEMQVLPNLRYLLSVVRSGGIAADDSGMFYECAGDKQGDEGISHCTKDEMQQEWTLYLHGKIDTWERTLDWASPRVYLKETANGKEKVYDAIDRVSESLTDGENALRKSFVEKINAFNNVFFEPMDDITKELSSTWDASFFMMPRDGALGPPPIFAGLSHDIDVMDDFFEPESGDADTVARITGGEATDVLDAYDSRQKRKIDKSIREKYEETIGTRKKRPGKLDTMKKTYEQVMAYRAEAANAKKKAEMMNKFGDLMGSKSKSVADVQKRMKTLSGMSAKARAAAERARKAKEKKGFVAKTMEKAKATAKSIKETADKAKKSTALKVAAGGAVTAGLVTLAIELKGQYDVLKESGYQYVSYPREAYRADIPAFEDVFFDDENGQGLYTWGMLESSAADLTEQFLSCKGIVCTNDELSQTTSMLTVDGASADALGEDYFLPASYSERVVASFTGGVANTGMRVRGQPSALTPHSDTLLLTFSGGGHSADYAFSSTEKLSEDMYSLGVSVQSSQNTKHELNLGGPIGLAITLGMAAAGQDLEGQLTFSKSMRYDRSFAWNKHGRLQTSYTLGDPEVGDKFVVRVGADKRFGTPIFTTMGGRSSCPGEPLTVWREIGYELNLAQTPQNKNLNPGEPAVVQLIIQTGTMYREASKLGLRLVDGVASSVREVMKSALEAYEQTADAVDESIAIAKAIEDAASAVIAAQSPAIAAIKKAAADAVSNKLKPSDLLKEVKLAADKAPALGAELNDVEFSLNGVRAAPLGEIIALDVVNSDLLNSQATSHRKTVLTLKVKPLSVLTRELRYVQLRIQSMCESRMFESRMLDRDPIQSTVYLQQMTWSQKCPDVNFDSGTVNQYASASVSKSNPGPLKLKVFNPTREVLWPSDASPSTAQTNPRLASVKVQYRLVGQGEWISAKVPAAAATETEAKDSYKKNLLCPYSRSGGCPFDWDVNNENEQMLSGFKDGVYEIRVKAFCKGGDAFADVSVHESVSSESLTLTVDTVKPLPSSKQEYPESHTVSVTYFEPIDCSGVSVKVTKVLTETCAAESYEVPTSDVKRLYTISCANAEGIGKWIMQYPRSLSGTFEVELKGVKDIAGNCEGFNPTSCEANKFRFTTFGSRNCATAAADQGRRTQVRDTVSSLGRIRVRSSSRGEDSSWMIRLSPTAFTLLAALVVALGAITALFVRRASERGDDRAPLIAGTKANLREASEVVDRHYGATV